MYKERSEEKRQKYLEEIKEIKEEDIFWVDESGVDEDLIRGHGRAVRGKKVYGEVSGNKFARQSVVSALNKNKPVAALGYQGTCNAILFNAWIEKVLVRELSPGNVVIMDNASFHKSEKTRQLIEATGCRLIFLPPYSPDLNPIEHFWSWIKNDIRSYRYNYQNLEFAMMAAVNLRQK